MSERDSDRESVCVCEGEIIHKCCCGRRECKKEMRMLPGRLCASSSREEVGRKRQWQGPLWPRPLSLRRPQRHFGHSNLYREREKKKKKKKKKKKREIR